MWSRRKDAVRAEAEALERAQAAAVVAQERAALEEKTDTEILQELDLRDPGEMGAGDDFTGFMKSAVPDRLRRRALRKLWATNPALASVDELVEYGEDFTDAGTVIENLKTAYQIGSGMLKHVREVEKQEAKVEIAAPGDDQASRQDGAAQEPGAAMGAGDHEENHEENHEEKNEENIEDEVMAVVARELPAALPAQNDAPDGVVKRKMRFEFTD